MDVLAKKCKGIGKAQNYDGCKKLSINRRYGLCRNCYIDWLLHTEEGKAHLEQSKLKGKKKAKIEADKKEREKIKKIKEELTDYKFKLQDKVNEIVRLIDVGQPCLATQLHAKQIHAGHVYSRGSQQSMRFNLHNIHRQSAQSNWHQSDDLKMRDGIIREYGEDYMNFITSLKQTPAIKLNNTEFKRAHTIASSIVTRMRREGEVYDTIGRLKMRNKVNMELGIYNYNFCIYDKV